MKRGLLLLLTAALTLALCAGLAEETGTPGLQLLGDEDNPTGLTISTDAEDTDGTAVTRPETPETAHIRLFKYTSTLVLRGIFEKSGFFFHIPNYWDTRYVLAQIEYTVSQMIDGVPATLTFYINDHPVYSCPVTYDGGVSQIVYVSLPLEFLEVGYNEFAITGYVRLYDDEDCLDDFSGASWISISESSFIEAGYDLVDADCQLSYYPYPLISTMDENGADLTVYVPEQALEEELRAAFLLRADLGNETDSEDRIGFRTFSGRLPSAGNALVIAQADRLPADVRAHLPEGVDLTREGAFVYEYGSDGAWVMAVTASDAASLTEAAFMLMDSERVTQEKYDWTFVSNGSSEAVVASRSTSALIENGETIKGITNQDGIEFIGPFHQESTVYLPFSGGFVLGEGGKVELIMRYSDNLDFDRSMVTVYWGSTPVASRKLDPDKTSLDTFSFMMPSDVVGTHAASIKIAFDLEIKELYCTKRADEMPWAYVSGESTLYFPSGNASTYDLSLRPYPFQRLGLFNSVAVVVPDQMDANEYAAFGRVAALLGADVHPYGLLKVWYASNFPTGENAHIIAIGTWKDNLLLQALNKDLSFRFNEDGSRFESNDQLLLSERYAAEITALQLIRSPYQEGKAVLAVCAPDSQTLTQLDRYAAVQRNTWTLAGDAFLIDRDLETKSYRFLKEETVEKATLRERLEANKDAIMLTLVSTSVMLLMLIAVILILLRYRRNRREEEKKK
ncbi:MAG: cellulose biosynthesis cyclic di-GMP-binding regulatory protein BcsB [Clostridia bacterium]|nr:cellulose biosynthesis cyclic di-GMP-binding regulatory protein BcsB [Clostridia bacterium]